MNTWGPKKLLDPDTLAFRLASAADQPFFEASREQWYDEVTQTGWRRSVGAVYHMTNHLSLTANFSNGIELPDRNRTVLPTEQVPLPYRGETIDVGLSFSLLNDKIVGSIKAFETKFLGEQANGQVTTAFVQPNNVVQPRIVAERVADSDRELAEIRREEEQGYGNRKHKANAWVRYRFTDGRLKGLALAGGARYQSRNIAGVDLLTNTPLYGNDRLMFDAMFQYRTRGLLGLLPEKVGVSWQVNVENLFNDQTIYITKAALDDITRTRYIRRGFREDPRNVSLTVRLDF